MIYSGTRPFILYLSFPMLTKCVPSFTSYCIRGYFFSHFIFTQCTTHLIGISKNVICILKTWKQIRGRFKTKWAHGLLLVGESNMRLNNTPQTLCVPEWEIARSYRVTGNHCHWSEEIVKFPISKPKFHWLRVGHL